MASTSDRYQPIRATAARVPLHLFALALALISLFPLIWMVAASLKPEADVLAHPFSIWPTTLEPSNYSSAFHTVRPYLWNSIKLAVLNVTGVLLVSSLAGFGFGRLSFIGRDLLFGLVLATAIVPSIAYLIPQYIMFQKWGWVDTHYPLWVPRVLTPVFGTFLMRQAFKVLPQELDDAARIDGAGIFSVYWRILLPQCRPALAAIAILTFVESWNDLFGPLIFINSSRLQTLPVALALFQGEFFTRINLLMAAATITIVPVLVVYVLGQRYLIQGFVSSGTNG